jgi:hypothetical protein
MEQLVNPLKEGVALLMQLEMQLERVAVPRTDKYLVALIYIGPVSLKNQDLTGLLVDQVKQTPGHTLGENPLINCGL